jgi:hypothetical protein
MKKTRTKMNELAAIAIRELTDAELICVSGGAGRDGGGDGNEGLPTFKRARSGTSGGWDDVSDDGGPPQ